MNCPGIGVLELETRASRQRLHAQKDLAELAGAASLLLVSMMTLGGCRDRLQIGDLRWVGADLYAELIPHSLHYEPQMQLAHAA